MTIHKILMQKSVADNPFVENSDTHWSPTPTQDMYNIEKIASPFTDPTLTPRRAKSFTDMTWDTRSIKSSHSSDRTTHTFKSQQHTVIPGEQLVKKILQNEIKVENVLGRTLYRFGPAVVPVPTSKCRMNELFMFWLSTPDAIAFMEDQANNLKKTIREKIESFRNNPKHEISPEHVQKNLNQYYDLYDDKNATPPLSPNPSRTRRNSGMVSPQRIDNKPSNRGLATILDAPIPTDVFEDDNCPRVELNTSLPSPFLNMNDIPEFAASPPLMPASYSSIREPDMTSTNEIDMLDAPQVLDHQDDILMQVDDAPEMQIDETLPINEIHQAVDVIDEYPWAKDTVDLGKDISNASSPIKINSEISESEIRTAFTEAEGAIVDEASFIPITVACELPRYINSLFFRKIMASHVNSGKEAITFGTFESIFTELQKRSSNIQELTFNCCCEEGNNFLTKENLYTLVTDVVRNHPSLQFLAESALCQDHYIDTVVCRIFYETTRFYGGNVQLYQFIQASLYNSLVLLESIYDVNEISDVFSYKHFYVIYLKFWELDADRDFKITFDELCRYDNFGLSSVVLKSILSMTRYTGAERGKPKEDDDLKMSYLDFVWFIISEEDKTSVTAIQYWFRLMDLDQNGKISMSEMEFFYNDMLERMEMNGYEAISFENCLCQMLDLIHPKNPNYITLSDLKRHPQNTSIFFNQFFNLNKFLIHERQDNHLLSGRFDVDDMRSDWVKYAETEYELIYADDNQDIQSTVVPAEDSMDIEMDDFKLNDNVLEDDREIPHHLNEMLKSSPTVQEDNSWEPQQNSQTCKRVDSPIARPRRRASLPGSFSPITDGLSPTVQRLNNRAKRLHRQSM